MAKVRVLSQKVILSIAKSTILQEFVTAKRRQGMREINSCLVNFTPQRTPHARSVAFAVKLSDP